MKGIVLSESSVPVLKDMARVHRSRQRNNRQLKIQQGARIGKRCPVVTKYQVFMDAESGSIKIPFKINAVTFEVEFNYGDTPSDIQEKFDVVRQWVIGYELTVSGIQLPYGSILLNFNASMFDDPVDAALIQDESGTIVDTLTGALTPRFHLIRIYS